MRGALILIDALKKIDVERMILITSLTEGLREGVGSSEDPKRSGEWGG